ncbi:MAG: alginate export family protein [Gallionellaceae bacterium]|nr:alginate export family protein [Gallionellaceae bacterium]
MQQLYAVFTAFALLVLTPEARAAETITEALTGGKDFANVQYRYEGVRNPGKVTAPNYANASTVRLRFGYETATFKSFAVLVEAEALKTLGGGNYDSKANGKTSYAVVADPEFTEMNQAYLSYKELDSRTTLKWGRQRLILDNARFIGNVGWRQNEQTYDAFTVVNDFLPDTKITAGYISNVNRVFSDNALASSGAAAGNHKMKSPIFNINYKGWAPAELVGYGYFLDYDLPAANYANSTKTYGLRMKGSTPMGSNDLLYTAEYASQANYKDNPSIYRVHYTFLEGGVDIKSAEFKLGYEVLGSTGTKAFSTPLATLHAFNGWVDMFLTTPATGLKDTYLSAGTTLADIKFGAVYHDFRAATDSSKLGTEWNLVATKSFTKNYLLGAKYGRFNSSSAPARVDTNKFWLWAEAKF